MSCPVCGASSHHPALWISSASKEGLGVVLPHGVGMAPAQHCCPTAAGHHRVPSQTLFEPNSSHPLLHQGWSAGSTHVCHSCPMLCHGDVSCTLQRLAPLPYAVGCECNISCATLELRCKAESTMGMGRGLRWAHGWVGLLGPGPCG